MSIWTIVTDSADALNQIGAFLMNIPQMISDAMVNVIIMVAYPFLLIINTILSDLNLVYTPFASLLNSLTTVSGMPQTFYISLFPLPPEWTILIGIQITISMSVKSYKWIREIISWLPTMSAGGP